MEKNAVPAPRSAEIFTKYIATRKVLIADTSSASRAGLGRLMSTMGAKGTNLILVSTFDQAIIEMENHKPEVVLCDFDLGNRCGLDLIQMLRKNHPDMDGNLFVLVTGNTSQSAVAQAAEEDVDTYILKPYTLEVIRNAIVRAAVDKIAPSNYVKKIKEGKALLFDNKLDEALKAFEEAKGLDPRPALAHFYFGQVQLIKKAMEVAQGSYQDGLAVNKIHYKCLVGLFELLMERKEYKDAYELVKKISRYFPANPTRLTQVLRLAIMTKSYEDIERYYQSFVSLETRHEELIRYICAALVICGRYYLQINSPARAFELFTKATTTAAGRTSVLREVIQNLVEFKQVKYAEDTFLPKFHASAKSSADYAASKLLIFDQTAPAGEILALGRKFLADGLKDFLIYTIVIRRSLEAGFTDAAETLVQEAGALFPERKPALEALVKATPKKA